MFRADLPSGSLFIYNEPMKSLLAPHRKQLIALVALLGVGIVFFTTTSPDQLPLLLLVLPFLYIFAVFYLLILLACRLIGVKQARLVALIVAVFGVLLFVLGSLHQLTLRDALISLVLTASLTWYVTKVTKH